MRCSRVVVPLLCTLVWVPGCSAARDCTAMGTYNGVEVSGAPGMSRAEATSLRLRVCSVEGACWSLLNDLHKAHSAYTNEWVSWVDTGGSLPDGELEVSASYRRHGGLVRLPPVTLTPKATYANGKSCGNSGSRAAVRVTPSGLDDVTA